MARDKTILYQPTPLHANTAEQNRGNKWASWFGYSVPASYGDVVDEHAALMKGSAIADFVPYPIYEVTGKAAAHALDRVLTRPVSKLENGEVINALVCASSGHLVAMCTIMRLAEERFFVAAANEIGAWLAWNAPVGEILVMRLPLACIGVFGPNRREVLTIYGLDQNTDEAGFITSAQHKDSLLVVADLPGPVAPGGGGSLVFANPDDAGFEWESLRLRGKASDFSPVGLEALERKRIDLGIPGEGKEFHAAPNASSPEELVLPSELGLEQLVDQDGRMFNGAHALKAATGTRRLVRIEIDTVSSIMGKKVRSGGQVVGRVTSAYEAAELGVTRALALVQQDASGDFAIGVEQIPGFEILS